MDKNNILLDHLLNVSCTVISLIMILVYSTNIKKFYTSPSGVSLADKNINSPVIVIDAGHGGEDCGAIGKNGVYEKDINLNIAFEVYYLLKASGYYVVMTRDKDILLYDTSIDYTGRKKALDMAKRLEITQSFSDPIFISIHQNSFPKSQYCGLQVYYSSNNPSSFDLAERLQNDTRELLQPSNQRKTKPSDGNIYLLEKISSPAILVECGFLSNPTECSLLSSENYQKDIATVIYISILNYVENQR
jgi:N-acetylmuramoyl-L-alanine amidase